MNFPSILQAINIILILSLLFIAYKYAETFWTFKVNKPYLWTQEEKNISKELKALEFESRDKLRFYFFWFQIERLKNENVKGDFAELGVYKGKIANIIYEMDKNRVLHLFDTFKGFDEKDLLLERKQVDKFNIAEFSDTSLEGVKNYINGSEKIIFHPGHFPETTAGLENDFFSFVHLDADLYASTLAGLNFFYPRLSPGGVIVIHDYNHNWEGVKKAVKEFMPNIPESLIELPDIQGSAMIIKNKSIVLI